MAPIILAGHSHMAALVGDVPTGDPALLPGALFPEISALYGPWPRDSGYWERLAQLCTGARVAILWEGNHHNVFYLFQSDKPFDFWSKSVARIVSGFQLVPQRMVREKFRPSIEQLSCVIELIQKSSPSGVAVIGTPPPKENADELRILLKGDPLFVDLAAQMGRSPEQVKITPAPVRLKLWYLLQEMMADAANKSGAQFIPIPQETIDADGYLRREFWAKDLTHANHEYGQIMARKILTDMW
jgi:hypothetical protein